MSLATLDDLRRAGEALTVDVSRALYRAHAGLDAGADLAPIYARHAEAVGPAALELALESLGEAPALAEWQVEARTARVLASYDEREIAWERAAFVRTADGQEVEYARITPAIANAGDRRERLALDDARAALVAAELAPMRRERLERERDAVERLGLGSYVDTFTRLSGIDVRALGAECERLLRDTAAMWDDVLPQYARRRLGVPAAELTRADALALFRAPEFDAAFPAGAMSAVVRVQVEAMGVDPTAVGRVRYDIGERTGKRARAFCAPVRVPEEVYLVLRPQGGAGDWRTLLHELGHALHFGYMRADLPFEHRWAGDNSVTEGYAMLFDHLTHDRRWLLRQTELGRTRVVDFQRSAAFEELHFMRRYAAKLLYELELYAGDLRADLLEDLYVERLGNATRVGYRTADAFVDVDPRFYSARYLRAWQFQAALATELRDRFNEDWWRNPNAGPYLVDELWSEGQRENADAVAVRVSGGPLSFAPVIHAIERVLA